jgi:murein peptide amidase A
MNSSIFGHSANGLPIPMYHFGSRGPSVLIIGGVHGNEPEGIACANGLLDIFSKSFPYHLRLDLIPTFNMDGALTGQRKNGNGVDLNRNLPTNDWTAKFDQEKYFPGGKANSEPESQALVNYLKIHKIAFVISLHSWHPLLNINGACKDEAEAIKQVTGYEIKESIGYPTPGCLGTYAGLERDIPTITYEIERGLNTKAILKTHCRAVVESLKVCEGRGR